MAGLNVGAGVVALGTAWQRRLAPLLAGAPLLGACWYLLWTREGFWNPLSFIGLWSGAILVMYATGRRGHPGLQRHVFLMALSVPLWWWFELVNLRVGNWQYVAGTSYSWPVFIAFSSIAFSSVIPALDAAWGLLLRRTPASGGYQSEARRWYAGEMALGLALQVAVLALPKVFFPGVWLAPFLVLDGLVGLQGGRSLAWDLAHRRWRLPAAVAAGGLLCGFLWELWNYGATPKWVYHIPWADFGRLFEMPILGYGGYVPFAWSVYQLLQVRRIRRLLARDGGGASN